MASRHLLLPLMNLMYSLQYLWLGPNSKDDVLAVPTVDSELFGFEKSSAWRYLHMFIDARVLGTEPV